jgi:chromosome segregation ATPase
MSWVKRGNWGIKQFALLLSLVAAVSFSTSANAKQLYRYLTDKGVPTIDDHVPPEFTKNGYEILSPDGRVLQTIPRQLTGVEGERKRAADAEAKRLREWDKNLLLRYSSVDDIAAARERALREIDARMSILRSNLQSAKAQVEHEQEKAADMERRGGKVPEEMTANIAKLKMEAASTEESIAERQKEKEAARVSYQKDIDRFKTLQDVVDYRRSNSGGTAGDKEQ